MKAAQSVYHSERYKRTMDGDMLLWTIVDKTVYLEVSEFKEAHNQGSEDYDQIAAWHRQILSVIELPDFPKSL